jgi:PHD/YefM family antitoxin component YafN of YafNO toxin-antitoxin module
MVTVHPQYDDEQNPHAVIISLAEWRQIIEELEELDDIRAYDEAKAGPQDSVDFEQAMREIDGGQDA